MANYSKPVDDLFSQLASPEHLAWCIDYKLHSKYCESGMFASFGGRNYALQLPLLQKVNGLLKKRRADALTAELLRLTEESEKMANAWSLPTPPQDQSLEEMLSEQGRAWREAATALTEILDKNHEDKELLFYPRIGS